ncbi:cellular tumor antigen p53-like isoform X3 [Clytia hemisphaerica]|uniref:p53 DNA-binding domain-containing protein n=1 Tax=Clytia hemisphaerica TaxID=252671 RepID=A0A7M5X8E8_9CNID|eukprot:TCONS_00068052-protein
MGIERLTMNDSSQYLQQLLGQQPTEGSPQLPVMKSEDEQEYNSNTQNSFMAPEFQYFSQQQNSPTEFTNIQSPSNFSLFNTVASLSPNGMSAANQQALARRMNGYHRHPMVPGLMPSHIEQLPDTTIFPGNFSFELSLGPHTESATKSADYTFSPSLKKLYVQKGAHCPFKLKTSHQPPPNTYIKILPVYKGSHVLSEPVRRCSNHAEGDDEGNPRYHFIRANNRQAHYETSDSGRLYLTIPYTGPQVGAEYQTELLSFMCFNSCGHSSHSKRRIDVIFMLENNGQVLARQVIEVRVCACPGRDRNNEEQTTPRGMGTKAGRRGSSVACARGGKRRKLSSINGDEEMCIKTNNPIHYQILTQIQEVLENNQMAFMQRNTQSPTSIASSPGNVFHPMVGIHHDSTDEDNS